MSARLHKAFDRFDEANAADPNQEVVDGVSQPKELAYARRMTARLDRMAPNAAELLRLAVRCQHIQRWKIPRSDYPTGRAGYQQWRTALSSFHADVAAEILRGIGYDESDIGRVQVLLRKERLKTDPEVQLLEDVVCVVFLEHYLPAFAAEQDEAKLVDILRKTWRKMSDTGHAVAQQLDLPPDLKALIERAVT